MFTLENEFIKVEIAEKGAELQHLLNKKNQTDYMWSADPNYWPKRSPVLFPIVGTLKDNTYKFEGRDYHLPRHGFARDKDFACIHQDDKSVSFQITNTPLTMEVYPFEFKFTITYSLLNNKLTTAYLVENTGKRKMYFSVGGHPAFKVPLNQHLSYEDYYLQFSQTETAGRWMISPEGLIETTTSPFLSEINHLALDRSMFYNDAVVLKHLQSSIVTLASDKYPEQVEFDFTGFPFLGIWAAKDADFICIEPWCGIADSVNSNYDLTTKEGIEVLDSNKIFQRSWSASIF